MSMAFQRTAAYSSRIRKPVSRRSSVSPLKRKNSAQPRRAKALQEAADNDTFFNDRLEDRGILVSFASDLRFSDVAQQISHIRSHMFAPMPEKSAGMDSVRIAEVLNFRRTLPPLVSLAHVHALSHSPTATEREIARLLAAGVIRKIVIPGRASGADTLGEGLVLVDDWKKLVEDVDGLSGELRNKYCRALEHPICVSSFDPAETSALLRHGLLNGAASTQSKPDVLLRPGKSSTGTLASVATAGSAHISGTAEAAAQSSKEHLSGGSGATARLSSASDVAARASSHHVFSLPNMGPYLKLLVTARNHLLSLLAKGTKYRELPLDLLKERWEGGTLGTDEASKASKARREVKGVLPGRTKKWRQFYGLEFDFVLEECVGAGLVECFKTGAVGVGVRLHDP